MPMILDQMKPPKVSLVIQVTSTTKKPRTDIREREIRAIDTFWVSNGRTWREICSFHVPVDTSKSHLNHERRKTRLLSRSLSLSPSGPRKSPEKSNLCSPAPKRSFEFALESTRSIINHELNRPTEFLLPSEAPETNLQLDCSPKFSRSHPLIECSVIWPPKRIHRQSHRLLVLIQPLQASQFPLARLRPAPYLIQALSASRARPIRRVQLQPRPPLQSQSLAELEQVV